jgi:hypothetical protein
MIVEILRPLGAASRRVAAGLPIPKIVKGYLDWAGGVWQCVSFLRSVQDR